MKALITGITGFVGSYMAEYLLAREEKFEVFGTYRWRSRMENIAHIEDKVELIECDLHDGNSVRMMIDRARPDYIFHLAAQSYVLASWHTPADTISNNIISQLNLFEALRELKLSPIIQIAGSSEEYGLVYPEETPIKETNPLRPLSPYAVSKVGQDMMGYQYFMNYGMKVIRTRAFNHSGPRRGHVFVESNFARQVAEIEAGKKEPVIMVGNLEAERDFTDVRDIVRAYLLACEKGDPGDVYNICSGKAYSIRTVLSMLLSYAGLDIKTQEDPARLRPSDVPLLLGDPTKFEQKTGWKAEIPYEKTLEDTLNYWRKRV